MRNEIWKQQVLLTFEKIEKQSTSEKMQVSTLAVSFFGGPEAEPRVLADVRGVLLLEGLEDPREGRGGDALPRVPHFHHDAPRLRRKWGFSFPKLLF